MKERKSCRRKGEAPPGFMRNRRYYGKRVDLDVKSLLQQDEVMKVYSFRDILICLCEVVAALWRGCGLDRGT